MSKVDEKFQAKVRTLEGEVYEWYTKVREAENTEVCSVQLFSLEYELTIFFHDQAFSSALEVKAVAEEAQGDLGLDYAWLDDVTYRDWQKYHDLMRGMLSIESVMSFILKPLSFQCTRTTPKWPISSPTAQTSP